MDLKNEAYEQIKEMIIKKELKPGEPLFETKLSQKLHMSRTPIREAINNLVNDRLVETIPNVGNLVSTITVQDIIEIYDIRYAIEKFALNKTFPYLYLDHDLLKEYRKEVKNLKNNFSWEIANQLNFSIHNVWIERCGNERIKEIFLDLKPQISRLSSFEKGDKTREDNFIEEHVTLINLILENKRGDAIDYLGKHIMNVQKSVLRIQQHNP